MLQGVALWWRGFEDGEVVVPAAKVGRAGGRPLLVPLAGNVFGRDTRLITCGELYEQAGFVCLQEQRKATFGGRTDDTALEREGKKIAATCAPGRALVCSRSTLIP